ncbi:diguanylate cyclase (GGDEF) domain-containing protein [Lachnospiraceae bacterium JC7]|nr:diguanylate cyclase (GGDEF) domain-containing protein [Lachnospiraceae bacterium JC7]
MSKKTDSLNFKLLIVFLLITVIAVCTSGYISYRQEYSRYLKNCQDQIQAVSGFLCMLVEDDSDEFPFFKDYLIDHRDELYLPIDFGTDCSDAEYYFHTLMDKKFPDQEFGKDYSYEDFDKETSEACTIYNYLYWTDIFWKAEKTLNVPYTMLLIPKGDGSDEVYYIIDSDRRPYVNDPSRMRICDLADMPREGHEKFWKTWETGEQQSGFDESDNYYGRTYAFYTPFYMNGELVGIVGAETFTETINKELLKNALVEMAMIAVIVFIAMDILLIFINEICLKKLSQLQADVQKYTDNKDPSIADVIINNAKGRNEVTALALQLASMMKSIHEYTTTLNHTIQELKTTQAKNAELSIQADRDTLTGIRNRNAYEKEVQLIELHMDDDDGCRFGIAMIDLNYLKKINDTYGHEKGNIAIKKLCRLVCVTFAHSPVFRIGGDEFVVILKNSDYDGAEALIEKFRDTISELSSDEALEPWERVSAAVGWTMFDPYNDSSVENVFKRADSLMYENKKAMKANRE